MAKSPATKPPRTLIRSKEVAAAELALKTHVLASDPEMLAKMTDRGETMREIADTVNLAEAPEDAVCGLVIDLMQYCERENIDWTQDVISRASEQLHSEHALTALSPSD